MIRLLLACSVMHFSLILRCTKYIILNTYVISCLSVLGNVMRLKKSTPFLNHMVFVNTFEFLQFQLYKNISGKHSLPVLLKCSRVLIVKQHQHHKVYKHKEICPNRQTEEERGCVGTECFSYHKRSSRRTDVGRAGRAPTALHRC